MRNNSSDIYSYLELAWGQKEFRPGQKEIIESILSGRHTLGVLPTGTGKTVTFQIPALMSDGLTIVFVPFRSLMVDQIYHAKKRDIPAEYWNGDLTDEQKDKVIERLKSTKLLYMCPESIKNRKLLEAINEEKVSLIVIDEAHTFLDADTFRISYQDIKPFIEKYDVPILALTATCNDRTQKLIKRFLGIDNWYVVIKDPVRPNLDFRIVENGDMKMELYERKNQTGIIYFLTRKTTEKFYDYLKSIVPTQKIIMYHGGMKDKDRAAMQKEFIEGKNVWCIATKAFGTGLDKPDIRFVFHSDYTDSLLEYLQQAGRGGRDGDQCDCWLFKRKHNTNTNEYFIDQSNPEKHQIESFFQWLCKEGEKNKQIEITIEDMANMTNLEPGKIGAILNILKSKDIIDRYKSQNLEFNILLVKLYTGRSQDRKKIYEALQYIIKNNLEMTMLEIIKETFFDNKKIMQQLGQLKKGGFIDFERPYGGSITEIKSYFLDKIDWDYLEEKRRLDFEDFEIMKGFFEAENKDKYLRERFLKSNLDNLEKVPIGKRIEGKSIKSYIAYVPGEPHLKGQYYTDFTIPVFEIMEHPERFEELGIGWVRLGTG